MNAKEMFEKLDYEFYQDDRVITYTERSYRETTITFYLNYGQISFSDRINISEMKAINQQLKELNWL